MLSMLLRLGPHASRAQAAMARDGAVLVRVAAGMGLAAVALTDGPAQCTLKDDLAGKPFAMKDDLLDAMALVNPPVATLADLRAYDGCNLATKPPRASTVTALLGSCTTHKADIKDDVPGRTALGHVLALLDAAPSGGSSSSSSNPTAAQDAAFALKAYNDMGRRMVSRVNAEDKIEGKLVRKASDDLDRGTLSRECYTLSGLRALNSEAEVRRVSVGGVGMMTETEAQVALARNGDVLMQIHRNLRMLLAAGYRPISPAAETPLAGSAGDYGSIKYKGASGAPDYAVRYHLTPEGADLHMLAAIRGSCALLPAQLAAAHVSLMSSAVNKMQKLSYNLETALVKTHEAKSFAAAAADEGVVSSTPPPHAALAASADRAEVAKLEAKLKDRDNTIAQLKRPREAGQADPQGGPSKKGGGKSSEHCFDFARSSKCSRGDKCPFSHVCVGCGSTEHGSLLCPKTVP